MEVTLQGRRGESIHMQVIGFPKICSPLSTKVDVCHLTELQGFDLADHDPSSDGGKIDVLIGSDYCWEVISGEILRDTAGPVVMNRVWMGIIWSSEKKGRSTGLVKFYKGQML